MHKDETIIAPKKYNKHNEEDVEDSLFEEYTSEFRKGNHKVLKLTDLQ